jgi:signal transduction histidine kinase
VRATEGNVRRPRWAWWAVAAAIALLATSQWLHAPSVEYLISLIVATVAAAVATAFVGRSQRWWALSCAVALGAAAALAIPAQRTLLAVQHQWDDWRRDAARRGLDELRQELDAALASSSRAVRDALAAPTNTRSVAFDALDAIPGQRADQGVVLFKDESALAWSGTIQAPVDPTADGTSIIATPFYLALQLSERRADRHAIATILLDAAPPADRLATTINAPVAKRAGLRGLVFVPASDSGGGEVLHYKMGGATVFDVRAISYQQGEVSQHVMESVRGRAGVAFVIALVCFIIGVWRGTRSVGQRLAALAVGLACTALVPLSQYSNLTRLFDPAIYFTPEGGPLTGNAGALAATSALAFLFILALFGRSARRVSRWTSIAAIVVVAGFGPFLLRDLARGVQAPIRGVDTMLWLIWEVPLFLAAVSVLLLGASAGANVLGSRRGLPPWVAPTLACIAGTLAPVVWQAPGRWPWWYAPIWIVAIAMLALSRRSRFVILSASTVAAVGATTLVWGRAAKGRVEAAERDLIGLSRADSVSAALLRRFGLDLQSGDAPMSRQSLLRLYVASDIASAGNPIVISAWPTDSGPIAEFKTSDIPAPRVEIQQAVSSARRTGMVIIAPVATDTALELVMAAPSVGGGVTAAVLAPKSRLFDPDPFVRLAGLESEFDVEPPYTVRLRETGGAVAPDTGGVRWLRRGSELHGDWNVPTGNGAAAAHVEVELRSLDALLQRGALVVLLDLTVVGLLWFASVVADGGAGRWLRARRRTWGRSFRARLSLALFAFFVIPAMAFAVWSYSQLATDATQSRALLISETLRSLAPPSHAAWLPAESDRLDTPLLLYRGGELLEASDPVYHDLAPIGRFLPGAIELTLTDRSEETTTSLERVDGGVALFGYRAFMTPNGSTVIAAPARSGDLALGRRRRDLSVLVLFATAVGALAALWLSGIAARQLARPIGTLRNAALSIASGARTPPLEGEPTVEFSPVFTAFRRMASDLNASRTALEEAQRRTAAVLRNVASGVVAVDTQGRVLLANPRAEALLGTSLAAGAPFDGTGESEESVSGVVHTFLGSDRDDEDFALALGSRQLRGTLTRLGRGGAVVTIDDVTELARAQRVLAWGEMARQVAHEIKNPLTPIRLGVQHLKRARADKRVDFDRVLDQNVTQILAEIDRLDEIARAFSRYGAAPDERAVAAAIDVAAVVREVVALERMGEEKGPAWIEEGTDAPLLALARADELKEVLLNVLENARHAGASRVVVQLATSGGDDDNRVVGVVVNDNGHGIPADVLPRIFEPHFSTRTSGSGLGLAISRQLVEGWGGTIVVESEAGGGTVVTIRLPAAA